ncbi:PAS domain S-box protein [Deinococcus psychrotolerans]|uniref:PAS domain S-box protein n=1 Tax=Deinococcus psychrotolerans TaxID=2489213 RepID=A0A3G8YFM0_9DEIO|nr:PAS domain S-box protein [Deinococcus psychrotolerans]AZI44129.1 PAS domain S-box protein [Deinococcus psychrotolerans]
MEEPAIDQFGVPDSQLLRQAFAVSVIGVVISDARHPDLPIIFVNPAFERLSGYPAAEIIGRNCRFLQGQDRDQDARREISLALAQGQDVTTVLRNYRKDGTLFYNELTISPIRDVAGTVTHFVGFQNDVTAREQARQQEERTKQQLTSTLERITDGFVSFDQNWNVTYVNEAMSNMTARQPSETLGQNLFDLSPLSTHSPLGLALQQAQKTQSVQQVLDYSAMGKQTDITIYPGEDGVSMFVRDVTESREAQREHQISEERFSKVFETSPIAIFITRQSDNHFIEVNAEFSRQSGYTRAEFLGRSSQDLGLWDNSANREVAWSMVDGVLTAVNREILFLSKTGEEVYGVLSITPMEVAGEACVIGFVRDVTQEKWARDQLRVSEERYAKVFEASPIVMTVSNLSTGQYLDVNAEFLRQGGYTREEVIGRTALDLGFWVSPLDLEAVGRSLMEEGKVLNREVQFRLKSGAVADTVISVVPVMIAGEACATTLIRDVTEEKRVRDQLQASEERFAKVFDASPVAIVVFQVSTGQCIDANAEFLRRSGFSREEMIGRTPSHLDVWVNPLERDDVGRTLQAEGKVVNREVQFRGKSGAVSDTLVSIVPVMIGGEACTVMLMRDITLEKQSKQVLADSEERHRQIATQLQRTLDLSLDLINSIDAEGRFVTMSAACQQILGYTPEELIGRSYLDFVHPDDRAITVQEDDQITAGQPTTSFQNRYLHKDGRVVWLEWAAVSLPDEPLTYCVARDVTERRAAEEDQAFLAAIVNASHDAILGVTLDSTIRSWNAGAEELYGYTAAEAFGQPMTLVVPPELHAEQLEMLRRAGQGHRVEPFESVRIAKDGHRIPVFVTVSPILDVAGRVIGISKVAQDITARQAAEREIQALNQDLMRQVDYVTSLRTIDQSIASSADPSITLGLILDNICQQLGVDAATALLFNFETLNLDYAATRGFSASILQGTAVKLGVGLAGQVALSRQPLSVPDLDSVLVLPDWREVIEQEGLTAYYAAPQIAKNQVLGVIEVLNRQALPISPPWLEMLETLVGQAAIAVDNARLFEELERSNLELRLAYDETIEGWARALDLRDRETEGHSRRVTEMTVALCQRLDASPEQLVHVRRGALLHDIGKMGIRDAVLLKPGKLTDEEWVEMKQHPRYAVDLLSPIKFLRPALDIPEYHHEKWDGSGYPLGLKGEAIPRAARAFAVVDVYDALTSDRPYRQAWSRARAIEHIQSSAGTHFDPAVVQIFVQMLEQSAP